MFFYFLIIIVRSFFCEIFYDNRRLAAKCPDHVLVQRSQNTAPDFAIIAIYRQAMQPLHAGKSFRTEGNLTRSDKQLAHLLAGGKRLRHTLVNLVDVRRKIDAFRKRMDTLIEVVYDLVGTLSISVRIAPIAVESVPVVTVLVIALSIIFLRAGRGLC